jgi:hypothetical protein
LGIPFLGITIDFRGGQLATLADTLAVGLLSWLIGLLLTVLNVHINRWLSGGGLLGKLNPFCIFGFRERRHYHKMQLELGQLEDLKDSSKEHDQQSRERYYWVLRNIVRRFPEEGHLSPTAFGNIYNAFANYPRVMYGLDTGRGWLYIYSVLPDPARKKLDETRAYLEFWVHMCTLSFVYVLLGGGLVLFNDYTLLWIPAIAMAMMWLMYQGAISAAYLWGDMFRSAIDLYLPDVRKQLGFASPLTWEAEREMWGKFSDAIMYHDPTSLPERTDTERGPSSSEK